MGDLSYDRNFYPRSPCGERRGQNPAPRTGTDFYPRSPCGERPLLWPAIPRPKLFLSTLSLRRATGILGRRLWYRQQFLSTLSLRRATIFAVRPYDAPIFLSTLSLRRATLRRAPWQILIKYFYPRSPCGERRPRCKGPWACFRFLSTLSLRRATSVTTSFQGGFAISIHALLAESDLKNAITAAPQQDFYPRSPCGERPNLLILEASAKIFLSTLSLRRATWQHE